MRGVAARKIHNARFHRLGLGLGNLINFCYDLTVPLLRNSNKPVTCLIQLIEVFSEIFNWLVECQNWPLLAEFTSFFSFLLELKSTRAPPPTWDRANTSGHSVSAQTICTFYSRATQSADRTRTELHRFDSRLLQRFPTTGKSL